MTELPWRIDPQTTLERARAFAPPEPDTAEHGVHRLDDDHDDASP